MHYIDIIVMVVSIAFIVIYGTYKTKKSQNVQDYIKSDNDARWWTVGISVMTTQADAITFLSTPGQAYDDGMGFVQFYFGLPIAMVIICMFFIPIYHRLKVYTAYEYLESRFDKKTRTLTALLFLTQRGLSAGITIFAPAIILSAVLGWDLFTLNIIIGILVIIYTVSGGTRAVSVTQKQQMAVIFSGMIIAFFVILSYLPENINFNNALEIASSSGKMEILNFDFDFNQRYTVWSGLIGGTFLALSYFGTDQSQVQRYLTAKSVKQSQIGMLFNALLKVPMQFFILLVGIMVFVFYQFNTAPLNFNPVAENAVNESEYKTDYQHINNKLEQNFEHKKSLFAQMNSKDITDAQFENLKTQLAQANVNEKELRENAKAVIKQANDTVETNDTDYVFIHFILNNLPRGLIGLLLVAILSAAMSSTASELNALASTTAIDLYKRNVKTTKTDMHFVNISKLFTLLWGIIAITVACLAPLFDNLIELVNIIGSIFYGNVLGIFLLAFFIKYVKSVATFWAAIITQIIVIVGYYFDIMPYLWLNLFGCALVIGIALAIQTLNRKL
ncbi:sodium:solute symporter [Flavobacterium sp. CS20]|uniref:sodium:solute symporter n=1 Tax=Flavobacterium sp. CS20 TaxID=2775246 RepID=UPI001B3A6029|nr:sodium:solute symporter [Flavobacterium sp. CS20]QTY27850.1 sodium:solute symporter [Flavobacterium sp. CS20]